MDIFCVNQNNMMGERIVESFAYIRLYAVNNFWLDCDIRAKGLPMWPSGRYHDYSEASSVFFHQHLKFQMHFCLFKEINDNTAVQFIFLVFFLFSAHIFNMERKTTTLRCAIF